MPKRLILLLILQFLSWRVLSQKPSNNAFLDSVGNYICIAGIKHPEIVMKQAIWETGWFKSGFLMKKNNLFGFRGKSYLSFNKWQESVDYYKKWQERHYDEKKYKDYYDFLTQIRYGHSGYAKTLKAFNYRFSCP